MHGGRVQTRVDSLLAKGQDEKSRDVVFTRMMIAKLEAPAVGKTYDTRATEEGSTCLLA